MNSAVMMSIQDDNNPTQDNLAETDTHTSHEEEPNGWARMISLNSAYNNVVLVLPRVEFGRKSSCTVQIKHPAVSGVHMEITNNGGGEVWLKDLSTNGTYIDGAVVGKNKMKLLHDGAEVVLIKSATDKIGYKFVMMDADKKELNAAESKYKLLDTLGSGAFAQVRKCVHKETGAKYAMKIIDKKKFMAINSSGRLDNLMDEVNILRTADHPNIIRMYDAIDTNRTLYVVLELVTGGDLFDRIVAQEGKGFSEDVARQMFEQMLAAVKYLHSQSIVHRDLKPENILMVSPDSNDIRVSDFGLSRMLGPTSFMKTMCGTPQYLAPEILIENSGGNAAPKGYDKAVDLWALGCILYILLSGLAPFSSRGDDQDYLRRLIREGKFSFPSPQWTRVSQNAKDLVRHLLTVDPAKRFTVEQVEAHPWINQAAHKRKGAAAGDSMDAQQGPAQRSRVAAPGAGPAAAAAAAAAAAPAAGNGHF